MIIRKVKYKVLYTHEKCDFTAYIFSKMQYPSTSFLYLVDYIYSYQIVSKIIDRRLDSIHVIHNHRIF